MDCPSALRLAAHSRPPQAHSALLSCLPLSRLRSPSVSSYCSNLRARHAPGERERLQISSRNASVCNAGAGSLASLSSSNTLHQMRQILTFAGPALGIWLSGPIMSLIDTSVIGTTSSLELAALGPGTVMIDGIGYVFMFLSVATSNLIATSLANNDKVAAAEQLGRLLFVALVCGVAMLVFSELYSAPMLRVFVGEKNLALVPAAASYVKIRALAWPAVLVGMVAQSASLGMQDSWSPLKALLVASVVNGVGDILLCTYLGYGIAGAAWATSLSQYVAGFLMLESLKAKDYNPFAAVVPRIEDLILMIKISAPVFISTLSKVCFYSTITYFATCLGAITLGAHQVMVGLFYLFSVCGEPLGQTAQSFMPELFFGKNRDMNQAQTLLRSLLITGALFGIILAIFGSSFALLAPHLFTKDSAIIEQMHSLLLPFFLCNLVTPATLVVEGTLVAGREFLYLGFGTACCFACGNLFMLLLHKLEFGLRSCWWILFLFLSGRFVMSFARLNSSKGTFQAKYA